jgi:hypothetical protein
MKTSALGLAALAASVAGASCLSVGGLTGGSGDGGGRTEAGAADARPGGGRDTARGVDDAGMGALHDAAGASEGSKADGPYAGWCASQSPPHQFCDDFDEGDDVVPPWGALELTAGGSVAVSQEYSSSPPSSLNTIAPVGGDCPSGGVALSFSSPFTQATFAFELYWDGNPGLTAGITMNDVFIGVGADGSSSYLQLSGGSTTKEYTFTAPSEMTGVWTAVSIAVTLGGGVSSGSGMVAVSINGSVVETQAIPDSIGSSAIGYPPTISIGNTCNTDPSNPRNLYFDNVTFDSQ